MQKFKEGEVRISIHHLECVIGTFSMKLSGSMFPAKQQFTAYTVGTNRVLDSLFF